MGKELPKNDIPTLILAVLEDAPRHGYAIAREVERISEDALLLREGSLYPALRVLEQDGLIIGEWLLPEPGARGPARKAYTLTDSGRDALAKRRADWRRYANFMERLLKGPNDATSPA